MTAPKQRLIVDMDGVIADVYRQFLDKEEKETGHRQPMEKLVGKKEDEAFKNCLNYVTSDGFFSTAPLVEGAVEALKLLNEQYELFIVSAAMEFPKSLSEKYAWLQQHFPFLSWHQFVFCGSKAVVQGDIMVDDHFKNLDNFTGQRLLFTQPHNIGQHERGHTRVDTWQEILSILL